MARKRQARKCSAHCSDGRECPNYAVNGGTVCTIHGGRAPQVRKAAEKRVAEGQVAAVYNRYASNGDRPADLLAELAEHLGTVTSFCRFARARLENLTAEQWAAFDPRTAAEVGMFERADTRLSRLLIDLARLGLDEQRIDLLRVQLARVYADELTWRWQRVMDDLDLSAEQYARLGESVPRWMRAPVPAGARPAPWRPGRPPAPPQAENPGPVWIGPPGSPSSLISEQEAAERRARDRNGWGNGQA